MNTLVETDGRSTNGVPWLILDVLLALGAIGLFIAAVVTENPVFVYPFDSPPVIATVLISVSFFMIQPNQAAVLTLFGDYRGTDKTAGLADSQPALSESQDLTTREELHHRHIEGQ